MATPVPERNAIVITTSAHLGDDDVLAPVSTTVKIPRKASEGDIVTTSTTSGSTTEIHIGMFRFQISTDLTTIDGAISSTTTVVPTDPAGWESGCTPSGSTSGTSTTCTAETDFDTPPVTIRMIKPRSNEVIKMEGTQKNPILLDRLQKAAHDKWKDITWGDYIFYYETHEVRPGDLSTCLPPYAKLLRHGDELTSDMEVRIKHCQCTKRCDGVYRYSYYGWSTVII
ncbi:hypothetical protein EV426DRAFT_620120 [Tirmania nivea]|nr:hypothetical protein EV426DRAFT_620120 [Tirmania nivea]